jgi:hypothetical protein
MVENILRTDDLVTYTTNTAVVVELPSFSIYYNMIGHSSENL